MSGTSDQKVFLLPKSEKKEVSDKEIAKATKAKVG